MWQINGDSTVSVIDTATNAVTAIIIVGARPDGVACSPDGKKVYVTNTDDTNVSVIDTATNTITATVDIGRDSYDDPNYPLGVAVTQDGTKAYVSSLKDTKIYVIDTTTNTIAATINVGQEGLDGGHSIGAPIYSPTTTQTPIQIEKPMSETMTALTSSANEYTFGQPITFIATVDATSQGIKRPSGTVTLKDGNMKIGTETVNFGQAILTTSAISVGSHSIIVHYSGDNNFKPSTSSVFTLLVNQPNTKPQTNLTNISNPPNPELQSKPTEKTAKTTTDTNTDQTNLPSYLFGIMSILVPCIVFCWPKWHDFSTSVDPSTVNVDQGRSEKTTISVRPGWLHNKEIFLRKKDVPSGINIGLNPTKFNPKTIKNGGKFTSDVIISVGKDVSAQEYPILIVCSSQGKKMRKNVILF